MWKPRPKNERFEPCEHTITKTLEFAGIERVLCLDCGHLRLSFVEEVYVDDIMIPSELMK